MGSFVVYSWVVTVVLVQGYKYKGEVEFLEALKSECEKIPASGFHKFVNLSNFFVEKNNDDYFIEGALPFIWNGGGQFHRVAVQAVTERYQRGSWGPTTLNVIFPDMCAALFDNANPWYPPFFSHVKRESRNCTYNTGYVLDFEPFTMHPYEITIPGIDITGSYRVSVYLIPYDKRNLKMTDSVYCFLMPLEMVRIS